MIIEQAILTELNTTAGLTALVGQRIYYTKAPQDVLEPYIVFIKVSSIRNHSYTGSSHFAESRFQFSIYSTTYAETKTIAKQLQTILECTSGNIGTAPGVDVGAIYYDNETDLFEPETRLYHLACDYLILHYD